jgi:hydrogenase maturation protein HypF
MGRLFDAASVLSGCCVKPKYEGEAAILFEAALHELALRDPAAVKNAGAYQFSIIKNTATEASTAEDTSVLLIDHAPVFEALLDDLAADVTAGIISARFHNAVVALLAQLAEIVRAIYDIRTVVLAGGVFMNRYLVEHALAAFQDAGFTVALNRELPPNDASISFGQAVLGLHSKNKE